MKSKEAAKRLSVMLLAVVMTLSMTVYPFMEAFAEDGDEPVITEESLGDESAAETGLTEPAAPEEQTGEGAEVEAPEEARQDEAEPASEAEPAEELDMILEEAPEEVVQDEPAMEATELGKITVRASINDSLVSVFWTKVNGAAYYKVFLNEDTVEVKKIGGTENKCMIFLGNTDIAVEKVRIEAYRTKETTGNTGENDSAVAEPDYEKFAEGSTIPIIHGKLSSQNLQAAYLGLSMRPMLGEKNDGYAVAQGAATDGTYAYYMMASSSTQMGRILKVNLDNPAEYYAGPVIGIHHANGMTYDSKRHMLVAIGYGDWRDNLYYIDPDSLKLMPGGEKKVEYNSNMDGNIYTRNGMAAIAYVEEYDVYLTRERGDIVDGGNNDIMIFRPKDSSSDNVEKVIPSSVNLVGYVHTKVSNDYPKTYQSMDADEKYVYFLLSPGGNNKKNIILCLDWNSENLLPVVNGEADYIKNIWSCNNDGSGRPDAVMTIPIAHESEGLFHRVIDGKSHFYVSEYYGRWHYKTVTKKVKYKKKWKKVRKWYNKKTHKWTTKKPKKKYRGKSKKVWKYKTKTKKKKVSVKDYWARDDYAYYIGSF